VTLREETGVTPEPPGEETAKRPSGAVNPECQPLVARLPSDDPIPVLEPEEIHAYFESDIDADRLLIAAVAKDVALSWTVTAVRADGTRTCEEPMLGFTGYNLHQLDDPADAICWYADYFEPVYLEVDRPGEPTVWVAGSRPEVFRAAARTES
jgi:hypothetical protein